MARPKGSKNKTATTQKKAPSVLFKTTQPPLERTVVINSVKINGSDIVIKGTYKGFGDDYEDMAREHKFSYNGDITDLRDD